VTTVLVAEDEPDLRLLMQLTFGRAGMDVIEVSSGDEALARLVDDPTVDLAIIDLRMPGMDGFAVLDGLRAAGVLDRIGVVVVSAHADAEVKTMALDRGSDAYLSKPFRPPELLTVVNEVLARKGVR
jgi:CheY-like chemotaxis protein